VSQADLFAFGQALGEGACLLRGFADVEASALLACIEQLLAQAPLRHMETPGGFRMSVAISNCGSAGWTTDAQGYRYSSHDPLSGQPWPPMPALLSALATKAAAAAGYAGFQADACLINRYQPGARMSLHQDRNERDFSQPIVSVSLGLPATFLFGGLQRRDRPRRLLLCSGDVVVWGGPTRLAFHGVAPLAVGQHPLCGTCRYNLTFRKAL